MEYTSGIKIKLRGPEGILDDEYEIVDEIDKNAVRVKDKNGIVLRVHKSRVEMPNEAKIAQSGQTIPEKGKEKVMVTQATTTASPVAEKVEKKEKKVKA